MNSNSISGFRPGEFVIAGIGATAFGKLPSQDSISMNVEACRHALADAGITKELVDGVFVKTPTSSREFMYGQRVSEALGLSPKIGGAWDQGGAANISLISMAAASIAAGQCDIALICYADNPRTGNKAAFQRPRGNDAIHGWFSTAAGYAMIQNRHAYENGDQTEALGEIAVACRRHGAANPHAQLRIPLDFESYMASPLVVEPLRRDDCCLVSDGGGAIVVMSAKRSRELGVNAPVPVLGIGQCQTSWDVHLRQSLTDSGGSVAGAKAFAMAGLKPINIDVAQIYDCFTITVLMTLEDYGFFPRGKGMDFMRDGQIQTGGRMPLNTSGGLLSETGMPGLQLIMEGVRQMRGTAHLQVPGARHCLVSNQGGTMHTHSTLILGR
jgi:acetyl-CoA acetyltransferase